MPFIPRVGRPGLLGLAARTAVVAGTASAVSGGVRARQETGARSEFEAAQFEAAQHEAARQQVAPLPSVTVDLVAELQKLGDLKAQGVLSDSEFAAAKARLLS